MKEWKPGDHVHNELWWNGNVTEMIKRGTYKYMRPKFVLWVERGKITKEQLKKYDEMYKDSKPKASTKTASKKTPKDSPKRTYRKRKPRDIS